MRFFRTFKLSDWCLKVVIENLDLFIYSKTVPQMHIDFLLRLYADEVFREYSCSNTVTEECMLWFLNPHSKKINLSIASEKIVHRLQIIGSTITSLNLKQSLATANVLNSIICCVPHLKCLDLSSTSCNDKTLSIIQKFCPELLTLNLRECDEITDFGMENLCKDETLSLKHLDISDTEVLFNGLRHILTGMPSIQCLKFCNLPETLCLAHKFEIACDTYKNIRYNLTEFIYEYSTDNPIKVIKIWTTMCPNVKKVHFHFPVSEKAIQTCRKFKQIEEIKFKFVYQYVRINNILAPILAIANNLKILALASVKVPIVMLIDNFKNLKCLFLINVSFTDFIEKDIKSTETKLDKLLIRNDSVELSSSTIKAISLLISLSKNVTKLWLNCISAFPQDLFHVILNSMHKLTFVDLSYCNINTSSLIRFFEMPTVRWLYLDLCNSFERHSHLKKFLVQSSPCTVSWRIMTDNPEDSDSDAFGDS